MQTFLPYKDFTLSAKSLDYRRLGKQRVEAKQIFEALIANRLGVKYGWQNHPCVKMWTGYEHALLDYLEAMIAEWITRGYKNTIDVNSMRKQAVGNRREYPEWLGDVDFHLSHRSNLVRKFPEFYLPQFPYMSNDLPYIWPITEKLAK